MAKKPSLLQMLSSIQVERNWAVGNYNIRGTKTWSDYLDQVVAERVEKAMKKRTEEIAKYHEEHPDFP